MTLMAYVEEGILALLPERRGGDAGTRILTRRGEYFDHRGLGWLLARVSSYYGAPLPTLRQQYARYLGRRWHVPLPMAADLVLLPLNMEVAADPGGGATGYINGDQVLGVSEAGPGGGKDSRRCQVFLRGGQSLSCLNTASTVRERLIQGDAVLKEFLRRQRDLQKECIDVIRF